MIGSCDLVMCVKGGKHAPSRPLTHYGSRTVHAERKVKINEDTDDDSDYEDDDVYLMKKEDGFYPVKGKAGLFYRVSISASDLQH